MELKEESFLKDVSSHKLEVIHDDGVHRHLRFKHDNNTAYCFNLITWPDNLCIAGDMGTYVFSRLEDMFCFFRNPHTEERLLLNPSYWGGKLQAVSRPEGYRKYCPEIFKECVREDFEQWEFDSEEQKLAVWEEVQEHLDYSFRYHESEEEAHKAVADFESEHGYEFSDFWEHDLTKPTYHYIWCLYAIVWGIQQYDKLSAEIQEECT